MQEMRRLLRFLPPFLLLLAGCIIVGYVYIRIRQGPSTIADPIGSPIDLRGGTIVVLRLPDSHFPQNIIIYSDGEAIRDYNPHRTNVYNKILLPSDERTALDILKQEWCRTTPRFHAVPADNAVYEIGLRCSNDIRGIKQFIIPKEDLPDVLHMIDLQLPPLP